MNDESNALCSYKVFVVMETVENDGIKVIKRQENDESLINIVT
jgi:hypothetical protein